MATIYKRKGVWWIQYYYKGQRTQKSLRTRDRQQAQNELEKQKAMLTLDLEEERPETITLAKYIELYTDRWSRLYKSKRTQEYDQRSTTGTRSISPNS
jgi:hypothetical protein